MLIERPPSLGTAEPSLDHASSPPCATFSTILEQVAAELEEQGEELAHSAVGSIAPPAEEAPPSAPPAFPYAEPAPVSELLIDDRPAVFDRASASAFVGALFPGSPFFLPGVGSIDLQQEFDTGLFTPLVIVRPPVIGSVDVSAILLDGGARLRATLLRTMIFAANGALLADVYARLDLWGRRTLIIDGEWSHLLIGLSWDPLRSRLAHPPLPDSSTPPGGAVDGNPEPTPEESNGSVAPPSVETPSAIPAIPAPPDDSTAEALPPTDEDLPTDPVYNVMETAGEATAEEAPRAGEIGNVEADVSDPGAEAEGVQTSSPPDGQQPGAHEQGADATSGDEAPGEDLVEAPGCEQAAGAVGAAGGSDTTASVEEAPEEAPNETIVPEPAPGEGAALSQPLPVVVDGILLFPPIREDGPSLTFVGPSHAYVFTPLQDGSYAVATVGGALLGSIRDQRSVKFEDGTFNLARLAYGRVRARLGPGEDVRNVLEMIDRHLPRVASEDDEAAAQASAAEARRALEAAQNRLRGVFSSPSFGQTRGPGS